MNDDRIDYLIAQRERLTNRRDEQIDFDAVAAIDAKLRQVPAGTRNDVDLALGRPEAVLPARPDYGPQAAPQDYRIANRPGNPNWHGVKAWFDEAVSNLDNDTEQPVQDGWSVNPVVIVKECDEAAERIYQAAQEWKAIKGDLAV
jgi:hypothetical protein